MRKRVLLDVDGVIADLTGDLCEVLTRAGHPRVPEEVVTYDFSGCLSEAECGIAERAMTAPGFCRNLSWYRGARTFVELLKLRADVVAVTKPHPRAPTWAHERAGWLEGVVDRVVHTGLKELVEGDVLVEDSVENAFLWAAHHPDKLAIVLTRPWNRDVGFGGPAIVRAGTYDQVLELI